MFLNSYSFFYIKSINISCMTFISTNSSSAFWEVFCLDLLASFIAKVPFKLETEASMVASSFQQVQLGEILFFTVFLKVFMFFPSKDKKMGGQHSSTSSTYDLCCGICHFTEKFLDECFGQSCSSSNLHVSVKGLHQSWVSSRSIVPY